MAKRIGISLAKMHGLNVIHGDLTTSNLMLRKEGDSVVVIDFGLSFVSALVEDKAVDLYVLERAFSSTHPKTEALVRIYIYIYAYKEKEILSGIFLYMLVCKSIGTLFKCIKSIQSDFF